MFIILTLLLLALSCQDIRQRRISNSLNIFIFINSLVIFITNTSAISTDLTNIALGYMIIIVPLLFIFNRDLLGGGDVKLILALMPIIGASNLAAFITYTALLGLPVAIAVIIAQRIANKPVRSARLPYGVAISGAVIVLYLRGFLIGA